MRLLNTPLGSIILIPFLLFVAESNFAQVYVNRSATGANDGTSWTNAFVDLQTALTLTASGEIWVAAGTYRPVACNPCLEVEKEMAFRPQPNVQLYGGFAGNEISRDQRDWNTNQTILSGDIGVQGDSLDNVYSVIIAENSTSNAVLDGFIIEEGNGDGSFGFANGGGLLLDANPGGTADMQIRNCTFRNNYAGGGGAISIDCVLGGQSRAVIRDCIFEGNTASLRVVSSGAAIQMYGNSAAQIEPQIINCIFRNNYSGSLGGAIAGVPTGANTLLAPRIDSCLFENNLADSRGGALLFRMASFGNSTIQVRNCRFIGNECGSQGGAVYMDSRFDNLSDDLFLNCLFRENHALGTDTLNDAEGGAIFLRGSQNGTRRQQLINCLFDRNTAADRGGAITTTSFFSSEGICWTDLINCTFYGNFSPGEGGAVYTDGQQGQNSFLASNCIFWRDSASVSGSEIRNLGADVTVSSSDVDGGLPGGISNGGNNLDLDPQFADPENGDLHLLACSPLIDRGDNTVLPGAVQTDLDGDNRIHAATVDIGAYEIGVIYVNQTASGVNTGRAWADAFTDLQDALAVAGAGDQIWVARGTYLPVTCNPCASEDMEQAFRLVNHTELYGGFAGTETLLEQRNWTANPTILSGDIGQTADSTDNVFSVLIGENLSDKTILDGFIIEEGNGDGSFGFANGGGLLLDANPGGIADIIIRNCTFRNNYAGGGGAISIDCVLGGRSKAQIRDCIFEGNTASLRVVSSGAAIQMYGNSGAQIRPEIINCTFRNNYSGSLGGAIAGVPTGANTLLAPLIDSCLFENNRADSRGGAMLFRMASFGTSNVVIRNSQFNNNECGGQGGAMYFDSRFDNVANDTIINCVFRQNRTLGTDALNDSEGGALFFRGSQNGTRNQQLVNCVFDRNSAVDRGGAIATTSFFSSEGTCFADLINCTFFGNTTDGDGGAIHTYGQQGQNNMTVTNSIFWEDAATGSGPELFNDGAGVVLAYCDVAGGLPDGINDGGNNVDVDPQFVNAAGGDLHLGPCSPLINTGLNTALPTDLTDLDGDDDLTEIIDVDVDGLPRIFEGTVDPGAYEWDGSGNAMTINSVIRDESCGGQCDGEALILPDGGTPGYVFSWSNGQNTPRLQGVCAGTYYVTIMDSGTCMVKDSVVIAAGNTFSLEVSADTTICQGESVQITASAAGGSGNFSFNWDNGLGAGAVQTVNPEETTVYKVTALDNNICAQEAQVTITVNPLPTPTISGELSFCPGSSTLLNGGADYASYQWSTGEETSQISVSTAGIYSVTVTDANGCEGNAEVTVEESEAISPEILGSATFCPGSSTLLDGGADYASHQWSTGATEQTLEVSVAGTYSLTVTDAAGCSGSASIEVTENAVLTPVISGELNFCPGTSTTLDAGAFDSYIWSTGATTSQISVSTAGIYSVTVTDANGCEGIAEVTVEESEALSPEILGSATFCPGSSTLLDGGADYASYQWSTGSTEQTLEVSVAGNYELTVTDIAGCSGNASIEVTENASLTPTISGELSLCPGGSTLLDAGSFDTYLWSTGATTAQISVNEAGTYSVSVTDAGGCEGTAEVSVEIAAPLSPEILGNNTFCSDSSTILDGGSGYASYQWSTGAGEQSIEVSESGVYSLTVTDAAGCSGTAFVEVGEIIFIPFAIEGTLSLCPGTTTTLNAGDYSAYQWSTGATTAQITVSEAGTYRVTVTDGVTGCSDYAEATVEEGQSLDLEISGSGIICPGENTLLDGGAGYSTYQWSTGATSQSISVAEPGNYSLTVTNEPGCTGTDTLQIQLPLPAMAGPDIFTCFDTTEVSALLAEGTFGTWSAVTSGISINDPAANAATVSGILDEATLLWTISTENCPDYSTDTLKIFRQEGPVAVDDHLTVPPQIADASINVIANDLFSLADDWSVYIVTEPDLGVVDRLEDGILYYNAPVGIAGTTELTYELCVQGCGCAEGTVTIEVMQEEVTDEVVANAITPNGDGLNDYFIFDIIANSTPEELPDNELIIFNRWGDIVFRQENYYNDWSGTNQNGQLLPEATYYYVLRLNIGEGAIIKGDVTVIR
ncbi:MAG: gliding motility-associated C-terminal domain-containing protein [Lewinella sp.]|nr:gliding motility-associated C-terminal domain-containing protein [Lewinella sp.]